MRATKTKVSGEEIEINGVVYIPKSSAPGLPKLTKNVSLVRCRSAGVFFGEVTKKDLGNGGVVEMKNARRVWYWSGAASLSQLAMEGTSKPESCKFPVAVTSVVLTECLEIIPVTESALATLNAVAVWKQ